MATDEDQKFWLALLNAERDNDRRNQMLDEAFEKELVASLGLPAEIPPGSRAARLTKRSRRKTPAAPTAG